MGLFDNFEVPPDTNCPECGEPVSELQTKAFPHPYLHTIKLHEELVDSAEMQIAEGSLEAHTYCDKCRSWLEYRAMISGGKYIGVELAKVEAPEKS